MKKSMMKRIGSHKPRKNHQPSNCQLFGVQSNLARGEGGVGAQARRGVISLQFRPVRPDLARLASRTAHETAAAGRPASFCSGTAPENGRQPSERNQSCPI